MNLNKPNGGFPPINIKHHNISKEKTKEKPSKSYKENNLKIRNILSDSKIKPMIDLEENKSKINIINNL
jgi:hypothetical protein